MSSSVPVFIISVTIRLLCTTVRGILKTVQRCTRSPIVYGTGVNDWHATDVQIKSSNAGQYYPAINLCEKFNRMAMLTI